MRFEDYFTFQPKQYECFQWINKKSYIYYGGARGGGKTYAAIGIAMAVALQFPGIQIVILRKSLEELKQYIIKKFKATFPQGPLYRYKASEKTVYVYNGSQIAFRPMRDISDAEKEQGVGRHMYIIDEANLINEDILIMLRGSLRNGEIKGWKTCTLYTGNPGGVSDLWFKDRFIFPRHEKWLPEELDEANEYVFIQAYLKHNQILLDNDKNYIKKLMSQPEHRRKAWLDGDWNTFAGQFFESWNEERHVVPDFDPPPDWARWRSVDLGKGTHPSVCLWFAQDPMTGIVYCYREESNFETPAEFAGAINKRSFDGESFIATFADPNIWAEKNVVYDNEQYFRQNNIFLTKSSNKRSVGWASLKQWLNWKKDPITNTIVEPYMKVCKSCTGVIETMPILQYAGQNKEDCNTNQLDDYADTLRYFVMGIQYGWVYNGRGMTISEFNEAERRAALEQQDLIVLTTERVEDYEEDYVSDFNYADFGLDNY